VAGTKVLGGRLARRWSDGGSDYSADTAHRRHLQSLQSPHQSQQLLLLLLLLLMLEKARSLQIAVQIS